MAEQPSDLETIDPSRSAVDQVEGLPNWFDVDALGRCREVVRAIAPTMEGVTLTITSDFENAVREAHDDAEYAANYEQDRGAFGSAIAKVISHDDGTVDLVVDAAVLARGQEAGAPERTFAHEAHHIAIFQRGENLSDPELREPEAAFGAEDRHLEMARIACEEFRVEAPLCLDAPNAQYGAFPALLNAFDGSIRELSVNYQRDADVGAISNGVLGQFHSVATATGYVAAAMEAAGIDLPSVEPGIAERTLGANAIAAIERMRQIPPADEPTAVEVLEEAAGEVAELHKAWLADIGFRWVDMDDGSLRFDVLKPEKWLLLLGKTD
ncbi:MAG TPA: hypothetical protein VNS60_14010 [Solirubrobacterales bacterium]|nr:hypothetical protein [Solirubrobacterales bacterium]